MTITANRHIYQDRAKGHPFRLRLTFDDSPPIRLHVLGHGSSMSIDDQLLDQPFDMNECGQVVLEDVTLPFFEQLAGAEVKALVPLLSEHQTVGLRLHLKEGVEFNFWVDDDELYWGDEKRLAAHDWSGGVLPSAGKPL